MGIPINGYTAYQRNQTTTGCGNCEYCFNGQCIKAERCYGYGYSKTYIVENCKINEHKDKIDE